MSNSSSAAAAVGEEKEPLEKKQKLQAEKCPICLEEFEVPIKNDQLRILPCICLECLIQLIANKGHKSSTITCPKCQLPQPLYPDPYQRTQPSALAELFPTRAKYMKALKRNELVGICTNRCTVCHELATDNCLVCGLQCANHSQLAHSKYVNHLHQSIESVAKLKQQKDKEEVSKILSRCPEVMSELNEIAVKWSDKSSTCTKRKKQLTDCLNRTEAKLTTMVKLETQVSKWVGQLRTEKESLTEDAENTDEARQDLLQLLQTKRDEIEKVKKLSPTEAIKMKDELEECSIIGCGGVNKDLRTDSMLSDSEPTQTSINPSLLTSLSSDVLGKLRAFLRLSGQTISNRKEMIYKASWHGWTKDDFLECCASKSHTLILVKVADTGSIFGAYIEPTWPDIDEEEAVSDPSKRSFVFSLTNVHDLPIRFSLTKSNATAIDTSLSSVTIGERAKKDINGQAIAWCNMILFSCGRPANYPDGILVNPQDDGTYAYQLDEESKKSLPTEFELDEFTFGGSQFFGASEMEVYQL